MKRMTVNIVSAVAIAAMVGLASPAAGQMSATGTITLQGKLSGVADGTRSMTVRFYAASSGGVALATVPVAGVAVSGGIFTLPVSVAATVFNGSPRWWTVSVDGGAETARQQVTSVPQAIRARTSEQIEMYGSTLLTMQPGRNSPEAGFIFFGDGSGWRLYMSRRLDAGGQDSHYFDDRGNQWSLGNHSVASLTIRGGADLAENFDVSPAVTPTVANETVAATPGLVVSIDPARPGKLVVSTDAYDSKVAGVISGANGLKAGVILGKDNADPLIDGEHSVAMTGRVWVRADESGGTIKPGDRLTTSGLKPGHAMKVTDTGRADGAVIGKAMTGVDAGTGMVLVLVNLQ